MRCECEPVGTREIAERLGVRPNTVAVWRCRGLVVPMPEPRWTVSGDPAWEWAEVRAWAVRTRRWPRAGARKAERPAKSAS